jgi:dihydroxyacid dehydratase/phosphogluconate dehydratase
MDAVTQSGADSNSEATGRTVELRSARWFGEGATGGALRAFSHRSRMRQLGYLPEEHLGKPVIAILNTWSDINPCHMHFRERAEQVKRGVWQAGGFPLEFPVATLSETFQKPTPMLYRNLLSMETEELLRSYPVDDPALGATRDSVLVLRGSGPIGGPGMPEYGMLPIPKYLLEQGVTDLVRISDARMSGTSYGTCVLHIAPESHVGGPLALVRDGDPITLDVGARTLTLEVPDDELARRRADWQPPADRFTRGFGALYLDHITQADQGCDFDFLARPGANPQLTRSKSQPTSRAPTTSHRTRRSADRHHAAGEARIRG